MSTRRREFLRDLRMGEEQLERIVAEWLRMKTNAAAKAAVQGAESALPPDERDDEARRQFGQLVNAMQQAQRLPQGLDLVVAAYLVVFGLDGVSRIASALRSS